MGKGATSSPAPVDDYQRESDHGTLQRAAEINADPKRMAGVKQFHTKKMQAMNTVGRQLRKKVLTGPALGGGK